MLPIQDYGIYHVTGAGACSWFEFAQEILRLGGLARVHVVPVSTQEFGRKAPRPANSVLENRRLIESGLGALPHWKEGLAHYLLQEKVKGVGIKSKEAD
jgi:dTDP-4-dehydrorhamnose reductase